MIDFDFMDRNQIYQIIAGVSGVALVLGVCLVVLAPFFPAILLATILTLATWPAFMWLNARIKNTPLSAFLMTCVLAGCFILPLVFITTSITENFDKVYEAIRSSLEEDNAKALAHVPYIGEHLEKYWLMLSTDTAELGEALKSYALPTSEKLIQIGAIIGRGLFDITLGVLISYFFFRYGSRVAVRVGNLFEKFVGARGRRLLDVSKNTLISVVYGIVGTAVAQGALAALGFWIAGVPGAPFLGLLTATLSFVPVGPPMIWVPAAFWLLTEGETGWALFLFAWGALAVSSIDNVLKPYFISLGSDLPLLLVLLGALGGIMAFGFIGIFIGPTVLAVAYSMIMEWSTLRERKEP